MSRGFLIWQTERYGIRSAAAAAAGFDHPILFLRGSILILLVLADQVVHVGLRFCELHLVHPLLPHDARLDCTPLSALE